MKDDEYFDRIEPIRKKLYQIAYSYLQSQSMAVDAVDEAVFKGYIKKHQLRNAQYMETWLVRILINECNACLRHQKKELLTDTLPETAGPNEYDNLPLKLAIQKLPDHLKQIILLKYFGGYTIAEIADILHLPQGTVATRLRKAISLLRIDMTMEV